MTKSGEILDGYRAIRRIGAGGFGEVWLCRNEACGDLRALKFISSSDRPRLEREHAALCKYREEAGKLLNKALMPIEHANVRADGIFYIMPLADGTGSDDPADDLWHPVTLASLIKERTSAPSWFSSGEVRALITPVLIALQMLDDARLVHRDVKPENILFRNGSPCLSDISLLNNNLGDLSQGGTYGYGAPDWYLEAGGHPDMYGVAATLFVLLTGKSPEKMAQSRHRWPPKGEESLPENERKEWQSMHRFIARATDHDAARRFLSFSDFSRTLNQTSPEHVPQSVLEDMRRLENELEVARQELKKQREEFEKVSNLTMAAIEEAFRGNSWGLPSAGNLLAVTAERFEKSLKAAKSGKHWVKARDLMKRAMQALKRADEKYDPAIGAGIEEIGSGIERILKADREFIVGQVREVLAKALSTSTPEIGLFHGFRSLSMLDGLWKAGKIKGLVDLAGLVAPKLLGNVPFVNGAGSSILKIVDSAQSFLNEYESKF